MKSFARGLVPLLAVLMPSLAGPATPNVLPGHFFSLDIRLSPDGGAVASIEGSQDETGALPEQRELVIRTVDGKTAAVVTLPCGRQPQCWPSALAWRPDGRALAFALRTPGTHTRSVYTVSPDGSGLTRLFGFDGTISDLRYSKDGRLAMLATERARKEISAVEAGAPETDDPGAPVPEQRIALLDRDGLRWMSPADLNVYEYDWLSDGSGFVGTAAPGDGDANWWVAKLYAFDANGAKVIWTPPDARHQIAMPLALPDGRHVAFLGGVMSDAGNPGGDVYSLDRDTGRALDLTSGLPETPTRLGLRCNGHLLAETLAGEKTRFRDLGAGDGSEESPADPLWSGDLAVDARDPYIEICPSGDVAVRLQSYLRPPEIAVGPVGEWKTLTHTNTRRAAEMSARSVTWEKAGLHEQGWLLLPPRPAIGKLPMITIIHGGPAAAHRPGFVQPGLERALLDRGYAVFLPNPRGSYGQGESFTQANRRDFGYGDFDDIMAGIDAAEKAAPIDESKLGIAGHGYGGFMAMWAVTRTNRFKAAVAEAGIADWQSYYGENGIGQWMIPYFDASAYDDPAVYARSSPIVFIRNVKTPTLLTVGGADIEAPPGQSREFHHALKELGIPTALSVYPGEGHVLRDPQHRADDIARSVQWFDRYLQWDPRPAGDSPNPVVTGWRR